MKILLTLWAMLIALAAHTQTLAWAKQFTTAATSSGVDMVGDASGNIYITGYLSGTVDMDPGPGIYNLSQPAGNTGVYIAKLDAVGNFVWAKQFTYGNVIIHAIAIDAAGNVYTTGFFQQTTDFDPGPGVYTLSPTYFSGSNIFISKLDNNGNFVWAKQIGGNGNYYPSPEDIQIDPQGNVLVGGHFDGIIDFDPGPAVQNMQAVDREDAFVVKLDNGGNYIWAKQFGGLNGQKVWGLYTDAASNVYTTGGFQSTTDFNPGSGVYNLTTGINDYETFVSKLDANGGFVWAKQVANINSGSNNGFAIQGDATGNLYICGTFLAAADFNPGTSTFNITPAGQDIFLMKLDASGSFGWAGKVGGPGNDGGRVNLTLDGTGSGSVILSGNFQQTANFDFGTAMFPLTSAGQEDMFIARYTTSGSLVTAWRIGSPVVDVIYSVLTDATGNLYATGSFFQTVDFDPGPGITNLTSGGLYNNAFIAKYTRCSNITTASVTAAACNTYTYNNQVYTSSGTYTQVLQNAIGCDSIITLHLTIGGSVNTTTVTACDSYVWEGQTYTTSGLYTRQYTDVGGCDSVRKLALTIRNRVSTTVTTSICEGQTYLGNTASGTYTNTFIGANGCDSIRTLVLTVKPKARSAVQATICEGGTYEGYTTSGTYNNTFIAANGCDSIRTLVLIVTPRTHTAVEVAICEGETYFAAGAAQSAAGLFRDTFHTYLGCDSIVTTRLTVHARPQPNLGADRSICAGAVATFNPGTFQSYLWQDGSTSPVFSSSAVGTFWVTVANTNCTATDTVRITAIYPLPSRFLKKADSICSYETIVLQPAITYQSYAWSTGATQSSITVASPGIYVLKVTDNKGCTGADTTVIARKNCISGVYIPTAFTPNADGSNDVFRAMVYGVPLLFRLQVYNRYGQLIFDTKDPNKGWDGTWQGTPCTSGAFAWVCQYQLEGSQPMMQKGTVTLIR